MLTTSYKPTRHVEGQRRSHSYAEKLSIRLFGDSIHIPESTNVKDSDKAKHVAEQLLNPWKILDINAHPQARVEELLSHGNNGVYILDNHKCLNNKRHAEELLVDIAEMLKN